MNCSKPAAVRTLIALLAMSLLAAQALAAAPLNQIPSCYAANKLDIPQPPQVREVFILLDQTVVLDNALKQSLATSVHSLMTPGTTFTVLRFSAFSQGHYLDVVSTGALEQSVPEKLRSSIGVKLLKNFDACMKGQLDYGIKLAMTSVGDTIAQSTTELAKSDLFSSLSETSRIVKASAAPRRIVLLVSDMLENSSVSSFYAKNRIRQIQPDVEMQLVRKEKLLGDFGGASIFVMGAGVIPEVAVKVGGKEQMQYRDPKTLGALKQFWSNYFSQSNGKLEEFGMPALIMPVR
ncbi:hypothetical protein [Herminiimonas contaminans]|jgi:hypothetical protein|uniref:VWFA domain-containing protein n=1 Tax=Herminiimonas contaminans TaxID=1111140 RepID=A0ABS0EX60_9BURK|nr:hypothetical protein [Herminiimonas contaminans]MBF8179415.1 hypothetical protein [Herminiimonas contaminans]